MHLTPIAVAILAAASSTSASSSRHASSSSAPKTVADAEAYFKSHLSLNQVEANLKYYTSKAHLAGSKEDKEQADWTAEKWKEFGFDEVVLDEYEVLLNTPKRRSLTLLEPHRFDAVLKEDVILEDEASWNQDQVPTFHGYGKSGKWTGELVYANYGRKEDYDYLVSKGIDLKDKIVIVKYGYVFRGLKVRGAELAGAKGVIIYSDPADDGFKRGKVYPDGPWRPSTGVQRGSVQYLSIYPGDPLTPFEPALPNATRIPQDEALSLAKIPSLPISYADAEPFLFALNGTGFRTSELPKGWQGGLGFEYWTGPSAKVELDVEHNYGITPIWNVIATIRGSKYPDRAVIVGNHRDAWVRGAIDPSSGSAALLEFSRVIGKLLLTGWRPERTLVLASWDGEEYGLVGSTEYVEKFKNVLNATAVAYVNIDAGIGGPNFNAQASPSLAELIRDVTKDIIDPETKQSVYQRWLQSQRFTDSVIPSNTVVTAASADKPEVGALGSGSDFTAFLQHIGVSAIDFGFRTNGDGTYHSNYDSFHWMKNFGDPTFGYHLAAAEFLGRITLRLLDSKVVPFDPRTYAETLVKEVDSLKVYLEKQGKGVDLSALRGSADEYLSAAVALTELKDRAERGELGKSFKFVIQDGEDFLGGGEALVDEEGEAAETVKFVNDKLAFAERGFIDPEGIPGRPWYRHVIYAPGLWFGYASETFPAIREAASQGKDVVEARVKRAAEILENAVRRIRIGA
ncbi:hypothetical protein HDU97_006872 [Phlyctochytrium planicorne]|nr:hypothetical protein HDU97_006872 [Phlyctochytrium planicorne]